MTPGDMFDAGVGMDAHRGNTDTFEKTNFYTCASCTTNDAGSGTLLVLAVAALLRRRRR
jgi:MYXO-CTERM domain-containing protein